MIKLKDILLEKIPKSEKDISSIKMWLMMNPRAKPPKGWVKDNSGNWTPPKYKDNSKTMTSKIINNWNKFITTYVETSSDEYFSLLKLLKKQKTAGKFKISFTDEVKDGRSQTFDIKSPLKLRGKSFDIGNGTTVKFTVIKYNKTEKQHSSSSSDYFNYWYDVSVKIDYFK